MYSICILGGVSSRDDGKFVGNVTVMFADNDMFTITSRQAFDTMEEAEQEYRAYGRGAVDKYMSVFQSLTKELVEGKLAGGSRVHLCPLVDVKVFVTPARITQAHFMAAMDPMLGFLMGILPPLSDEEELE